MGMLIDGVWKESADRSMVSGTYQREQSALPTTVTADLLQQCVDEHHRLFLIASASCPWSHGAVIALVLSEMLDAIPIQWAGGPRIEGYGLLPGGPLPERASFQHVHEFYTATVPDYTGRSTVPILWDAKQKRVLSNSSTDIILTVDAISPSTNLRPEDLRDEIDALTQHIFDGLSNAVYRAGKSQRQSEYEEAADLVFRTLEELEDRLADRTFLFGDTLTLADVRLFATLVRFDTVYATHFRCTRRRLVEYPRLWRFTRQIFQMQGIENTVDFNEIRFGYYVNDGDHNPHGIIAQQPEIDWYSTIGISQ